MALMQFNGKKATLLFLNGEIIESWDSLKVSYTINDPNELHEFNSEFIYTMEKIDNDDGTYTVNIYSRNDFTSFKCNVNTITIDYLNITSNVTDMSGMFSGCTSLTSLDLSNWDTSNVTDMSEMFHHCTSLASLDLSNFDTSNVTNMNSMFTSCDKLTSLDLSSFDTGNVEYMNSMFTSCDKLTSLDLSNFDTSNVTNMGSMFSHCYSLTSLNLSSFDTSNVTDMGWMFKECNSLTSLDLSNFNTSSVTVMSDMFFRCYKLISLDLSNWNTSKVTRMDAMFHTCPLLTSLDLSNFNTSKVTNMYMMFYNCKSLTSLDLSNFNTSKVTDMSSMSSMFINVPSTVDWHYNGTNYQNFKLTESETSFSGIFPWNILCTITINYLDSSNNVIKEPYIGEYRYLSSYNISSLLEVSGYEMTNTLEDTSGTIECDMEFTAYYKSVPAYIEYTISSYTATDKIDALSGNGTSGSWLAYRRYLPIKYNATGTVIKPYNVTIKKTDGTTTTFSFNSGSSSSSSILAKDVSSIVIEYDPSVGEHFSFNGYDETNTAKIHRITGFIEPPKITRAVKKLDSAFKACTLLTSLDVSKWDTSGVTSMNAMFEGCTGLTSLDLSNWNVSSVTTIRYMFQDCTKLTTITGINNWSTDSLTDMYGAFWSCEKLTSLDLTNWNVSSVYDMNRTFYYCTSLRTLDLSTWNTNGVYDTYNAEYMFGSVPSSCKIYIGANWNPALTESVTQFTGTFTTK